MNLKQVLKKELLKQWKKWSSFMRHGFLTTFTTYIVVSLSMSLLYSGFQLAMRTELDLKPQLTPEAEGSFFLSALALLPLILLLEDLGIRLMPWVVIHGILRLGSYEILPNPEKRSWRLWIAHHLRTFYVVVSALWNSLLHQPNVYAANPVGRSIYFGIHVVLGAMLARIFIRRGFWQSYTIHVSWDFLLIGVIVLTSSF